MSKNLYIIGNGFDLNHGIPSRYADFLQYVCIFHHELFHRIGNMFSDSNPSFLWNDFENNLGTFNVQRSIQLNLVESIEEAHKHPDKNLDNFTNLENRVDNLSYDISLLFRSWIHEKIINVKTFKKYKLSANDLFITFNYTNTLETTYSIPSSQICYIHRNLCNDDSTNPIFGHGLSNEQINNLCSVNEIKKIIPNLNEKDYETISCIYTQLLKDLKKNTEEVLNDSNVIEFFDKINKSHIDNIYILGLSLGNIDLPYLRKVNSIVPPNANIYFSYIEDAKFQNMLDTAQDVFYNKNVRGDRMENLLSVI